MTITPQWKDELRARVTLSTVILRTDKLQKAGREWKGCCPFHDEKTPSFTVNDQKGFYHCFGCGAHGDVISWMTDQRGLSFMDAVKELAAEAGMEVPAPDPVAAKKAEQRASLIDVTTEAQEWFVDNLKSADGAQALEYLRNRGFSEHALSEFGFGYAPESKQALNRALSRFDEKMLVETGMRIATDDGTKYDRFRGRVMLPIQDARGRVIGFGGRILGKRDGIAKYLNSPDTPLFDKGRTLYNLHRAAPASRQTGRVIVVEGYMDVVALAQAGFEDSVAPLGTALTETQLEMLWRMVDAPVLCFDGDAAGQKAAMRAVERALPLLKPPRSLKILRMPAGLDPDDIIQKHGSAYFKGLVDTPSSLVRFIWESERDATPLNTPEEKAHLRQRLIEKAFSIEDDELRKLYRRELIDRYYRHVYPKRVSNKQSAASGLISGENINRLKHFVAHGERETLCRAILSALARKPNLIHRYQERLWKYQTQDDTVQFALDVFLDFGDARSDEAALPDNALDEIGKWTGTIPYPFLDRDAPEDFVRDCLDEAVVILVDKPEVRRRVSEAKERLANDLSEENESELMRLIHRQRELEGRSSEIRKLTFS
ncbi:MAG: DNA primase [Erythrobacter sp.]